MDHIRLTKYHVTQEPVNAVTSYPSSGAVAAVDGALVASLGARVNEFDLLARAKLNCVLSREDDHIEAAEAAWALDELFAAINSRLDLG